MHINDSDIDKKRFVLSQRIGANYLPTHIFRTNFCQRLKYIQPVFSTQHGKKVSRIIFSSWNKVHIRDRFSAQSRSKALIDL